jgi:hypothetical protein
MTRPCLMLILGAALIACSDGGTAKDSGAPGLPYGWDCAKDSECSSGLCVDSFCSKECQHLSDCAAVEGVPWDCGEVTEKSKIACYPRRAQTVPYTVGHDCSLDGKCAVGYRCMGPEGTTGRYCSKTCEIDRDCPARYRCTQARIGTQTPEPDKWCRRRDFCHPCAIDDQCGVQPDALCLQDTKGHGYCTKSCDPAGRSCAQWTACLNVGPRRYACKPVNGTCFNPAGGGYCDTCITFGWVTLADGDFTINEVGSCKDGTICYLLNKATSENVCVTPCPDDLCPGNGVSCFDLKSLGGKYCIPSPDGKSFGTCSP